MYKGFWIKENQGNNKFSFQERKYKKIWVAELINSSLENLFEEKEKIAFCELDENIEKQCRGLKNFINFNWNGKEVFIFDNHNHSFYFWVLAIKNRYFLKGSNLIHIDQHKDMRDPEKFLESMENLEEVFYYTNFCLNVGNFIKPALKLEIFKDVTIIDSEYSMKNISIEENILDLDMDFFSEDMDYIPIKKRIDFTKEVMKKSKFITIATSPFFMNQEKAINLIKQLFS